MLNWIRESLRGIELEDHVFLTTILKDPKELGLKKDLESVDEIDEIHVLEGNEHELIVPEEEYEIEDL